MTGKRMFLGWVGLLLALLLVACSGASGNESAVNSVTITTPSGTEVAVGETLQLDVDVDADAGVSTAVNWSSSDDSKATVNSSGLVTGEAEGTAKITATSVADNSRSDSVTVSVTAENGGNTNRRPEADAGLDDQVVADTTATVALDGSGSSDPDGDTLSYSWTLTSRPDDSEATLSGADTATPSFIADLAGNYTAELTVSDGDLEDTDSVTVEAICPEPIEITGDINDDDTWGANIANCADYLVTGRGFIFGDLVIEAGTRVVFGNGASLVNTGGGSLQAVGTAEDPIHFIGENPVPGYWQGMVFSANNPLNELTHVVVDGAGSGSPGYGDTNDTNIGVRNNARVKISNTTIRNSAGYGLLVRAADLSGFADNRFEGIAGAPIHLPSNQLGNLDGASDYDGTADNPNGDAYLEVEDSTLETDQTWPKINLPYRLERGNNHRIDGAHLTIEPGAVFEFESSAELQVLDDGALTAVGTADEPIIFRGFQEGQGVWDGILFGSNDARNELEHVVVDGAGAGGLGASSLDANVAVFGTNASLKLSNSTISNSGGFGIYLGNTATVEPADPESAEANNTFENNADGNVGP